MNQLFDDQKNQFNEPLNNQVSPQDYLPSKKMMSIIIGIIIIIIIIFFRNSIIGLFKKIGDIQLRQPGGIPTSVVTQGKNSVSFNINKDTDGDGIPDWQEALLGTDSEVYTTIEEVPIEMRQIVNDSMSILTTSDQLALAIYERSRANPVGDSYKQNLQAATAKEVLDLADSIDRQLTTYAPEDLTVLFDEEGTDITKETAIYKQKINSLISKINFDTIYGHYSNILEGKDTNSDRVLFQNLTKEAYEIKVPFEYIDHHLELMSALAKIHDTFIQESNINSDDTEIMRMVLFLVFQKNMNVVEKKITEFNILFKL